jgi:hypothetical protein
MPKHGSEGKTVTEAVSPVDRRKQKERKNYLTVALHTVFSHHTLYWYSN